jgi:hypothetical protein
MTKIQIASLPSSNALSDLENFQQKQINGGDAATEIANFTNAIASGLQNGTISVTTAQLPGTFALFFNGLQGSGNTVAQNVTVV